MRKHLILAAALALTLAFATSMAGCFGDDPEPQDISLETDFDITMSSSGQGIASPSDLFGIPFNTNASASESAGHLPAFKVSSTAELEELELLYAEACGWRDIAEGDPLFNEAATKYNDTFFEENSVVATFFTAGSSGYDYGVESVEYEGGRLLMRIVRTDRPSEDVSYTCDEASWIVAVAVPNGMLETCTYIDAIMAS